MLEFISRFLSSTVIVDMLLYSALIAKPKQKYLYSNITQNNWFTDIKCHNAFCISLEIVQPLNGLIFGFYYPAYLILVSNKKQAKSTRRVSVTTQHILLSKWVSQYHWPVVLMWWRRSCSPSWWPSLASHWLVFILITSMLCRFGKIQIFKKADFCGTRALIAISDACESIS